MNRVGRALCVMNNRAASLYLKMKNPDRTKGPSL